MVKDKPSPPSSAHVDPFKIVAAAIPDPSARIAPIFIGEGGYGDILNATGQIPNRHFHVPAAAEKALAAEDLEYLKIKGCFTLPAESEQLLKAYFLHVHPSFPVIDGPQFMQDYAVTGLNGVNLQLLWSMFSVSASYIPSLSRITRKELYIQRAKLLFDLSEEKDKIVLVQSALLMSFWFADTEDVKQSWYWTGIAFSIAQTLGLHREVRSVNTQITIQQQVLWRTIWQCCMMRDIWLAFGMGRPLRLNAADCDSFADEAAVPLFDGMVLHGEALYTPEEASILSRMWSKLISTSSVLRDFFTQGTPSASKLVALEDELSVQDVSRSSALVTNVDRHLKLHQQVVSLALARANNFNDQALEAAGRTTTVIKALLDDSGTICVAPVVIPLLVPAMVTYLGMARSSDPELSLQSKETLGVYVWLLTALEENYPAAGIVKNVFAAAQEAGAGRGADKMALSGVSRHGADAVLNISGVHWPDTIPSSQPYILRYSNEISG